MKNLLLLLLLFCARAQAAQAPGAASTSAPEILARELPKRAISLRWQQVSLQPAVWAHIWCVPRGHSKEREVMLSQKRVGLVTRADIDSGPSVEPSPFTLDLLERDASGWKRLGRAAFEQTKDVREIHTRFLDPATRRHPVLALHFGFTHWHEWEVFTMPRGWSGPIAHQRFLWGGEGGSSVSQDFGHTRDGHLVITEVEAQDGKATRGTYAWNGREWADPSQKWLVVGASGSQKAMQVLARRRKLGQAHPASEFPRLNGLKAGAWIWLVARYRSESEAREHAQALRREKVEAQVKLAH